MVMMNYTVSFVRIWTKAMFLAVLHACGLIRGVMSKSKLEDIQEKDLVKVNSPGHRMDGLTGTVIYTKSWMGTLGVDFDGQIYGFLPIELTKAEK
jgi:hypothetical protein